MGLYRYKAKKGPGKVITSVITAGSKEEAVDKISKMGYMPVLVEVTGSQPRRPAVTWAPCGCAAPT